MFARRPCRHCRPPRIARRTRGRYRNVHGPLPERGKELCLVRTGHRRLEHRVLGRCGEHRVGQEPLRNLHPSRAQHPARHPCQSVRPSFHPTLALAVRQAFPPALCQPLRPAPLLAFRTALVLTLPPSLPSCLPPGSGHAGNASAHRRPAPSPSRDPQPPAQALQYLVRPHRTLRLVHRLVDRLRPPTRKRHALRRLPVHITLQKMNRQPRNKPPRAARHPMLRHLNPQLRKPPRLVQLQLPSPNVRRVVHLQHHVRIVVPPHHHRTRPQQLRPAADTGTPSGPPA